MIIAIICGALAVTALGAIALTVIDNDNVLEHDYPEERK